MLINSQQFICKCESFISFPRYAAASQRPIWDLLLFIACLLLSLVHAHESHTNSSNTYIYWQQHASTAPCARASHLLLFFYFIQPKKIKSFNITFESVDSVSQRYLAWKGLFWKCSSRLQASKQLLALHWMCSKNREINKHSYSARKQRRNNNKLHSHAFKSFQVTQNIKRALQ